MVMIMMNYNVFLWRGGVVVPDHDDNGGGGEDHDYDHDDDEL